MGRYTAMVNDMWKDSAYMALSPAEKLLYNYLLNSPVNNAAGYYRLTKAQLRVDMCREDDTPTGFNAHDEELFKAEILPALESQTKVWRYDPDTRQVLVLNYLKYNKTAGEKQVLGPLLNSVLPLEKSYLHIFFFKECMVHLREQDLMLLWNKLDEKTRAYVRLQCGQTDGDALLNAARAIVKEALIT